MVGCTVHVVDDDPSVRDSVAFLLRAAGYAAMSHATSQGFLDVLDGHPVGCVVLDLRMPEPDGLEVVRRLQAMEAPPAVILMTGDMDLPAGSIEGVFAMLEKPLDDCRLVDCVERALAARPGVRGG